MIKALAYNRKSRGLIEDLQKFKGELLSYCKVKGFNPTYFEEIGSSVDSDREEYTKLINEIKTGNYDVLVITDLSRLTRELEEQLKLFKLLTQYNMIIHSILDGVIDPKERTGKIMSGIKGLFNEIAYDEISHKMHMGRFNSVKKGLWVGKCPYGFIKDKETMTLVHDPIEAPVVRRIFREVIEGYSTTNISLRLHRDGIKTRKGKNFHPSTISNLLERRTYIGETRFKSDKFGEEITVKGTHEGIVSLEEFMQVRSILANKKHFKTRTHAVTSPLDKVIVCGLCGRLMQVNLQKKVYVHLAKCNAYKYGERCDNAGCTLNYILPLVYAEIKKRRKVMYKQLNSLKGNGSNGKIERLEKDLKGLQKRLKNTETEKEDLVNYLLKKVINEVVYTSKNKALEDEIKAIKLQIDDTEEQIASNNVTNDIDYLESLIDDIDHLESMETEEQNRIIKNILEKIVYIREGDVIKLECFFR